MLAFAMGGRVAEELCFDEVSTGAQNDLERATQIARAMVAEYGMSELVGPLSFGQEDANSMFNAPKISGDTAEVIDEEVNRLLNEAHDRAEKILIERRDLLEQAVRAAPRHRDDRRDGPGGIRHGDEAHPRPRDRAAEREGAPADARAGHGPRARRRDASDAADARQSVTD